MPKQRTPLKGRPFSSWSDEKLERYEQMFQDFIHAFRHEDKEKESLMQEVWKMLADEEVDRMSEEDFMPVTEPSNQVIASNKPTGLKKRPMIKKISVRR